MSFGIVLLLVVDMIYLASRLVAESRLALGCCSFSFYNTALILSRTVLGLGVALALACLLLVAASCGGGGGTS